MKAFAIAMLAACGGGSTTTTTTTPVNRGSDAPPATTGPVFGKLFENGAKWTFSATVETSPPPDIGPHTKEARPDVSCTVDHVHEMGAAKMSYVKCTGSDTLANGEQPPAGLWVANDTGLWWFTDAEEMQAHQLMMKGLDAQKMLIGATPKPRKDEIKLGENELHIYIVHQTGDAWCGGYTSAAGDEAGYEVCLRADKGFTSALYFSAGATTYETKLTAK